MNQTSYDDEVCYGPRPIKFFSWRVLIIFLVYMGCTVISALTNHDSWFRHLLGFMLWRSFVSLLYKIVCRLLKPNCPRLILNFKGMHYQDKFGKIVEARWDSLGPFTSVRLPVFASYIATDVTGLKITENLKQGQQIKLPVALFDVDQLSLISELNRRRRTYLDYKRQKSQAKQLATNQSNNAVAS